MAVAYLRDRDMPCLLIVSCAAKWKQARTHPRVEETLPDESRRYFSGSKTWLMYRVWPSVVVVG